MSGWAEYTPRFASEPQRQIAHLSHLVDSAADRLGWGGDVSYGFYLERPWYLAVSVVTCAPNRAVAELACPLA